MGDNNAELDRRDDDAGDVRNGHVPERRRQTVRDDRDDLCDDVSRHLQREDGRLPVVDARGATRARGSGEQHDLAGRLVVGQIPWLSEQRAEPTRGDLPLWPGGRGAGGLLPDLRGDGRARLLRGGTAQVHVSDDLSAVGVSLLEGRRHLIEVRDARGAGVDVGEIRRGQPIDLLLKVARTHHLRALAPRRHDRRSGVDLTVETDKLIGEAGGSRHGRVVRSRGGRGCRAAAAGRSRSGRRRRGVSRGEVGDFDRPEAPLRRPGSAHEHGARHTGANEQSDRDRHHHAAPLGPEAARSVLVALCRTSPPVLCGTRHDRDAPSQLPCSVESLIGRGDPSGPPRGRSPGRSSPRA